MERKGYKYKMWKSIEYTQENLSEVIDMTIEYYGEDNDISKRKFLEHEYFENNAGNAFIKLAYDEENKVLAGQYVVIPMKVKIKSEVYPVILSLNTLTREAYRGQKIFITLAEEVYNECADAEYKFCYGAPNPNSHPGFIRRLKFCDLGAIPLFLKIIHPSVLVQEKTNSKLLSTLSKPANLFFRCKFGKNTIKNIFEITEKNISIIDQFWEKIKDKYEVIGVRDSKFLMWRYINMPYRDYKIYAYGTENGISGYIIGRITEVAGMKCGMVVDFLVEEEKKNVAMELLRHLEKYFYSQNVGLMGCLMQKNIEEASWLKKFGFFRCPKFMEPQPFPIIYRKFNDFDGEELFEDFSNWFFTMGDYDVI